MLRYEDIQDISDGNIYEPEDEVLLGTGGCKGCSHCCETDMGKSIVLTPYDIYNLCRASGKSFDELLVGFYIEISMIDGVALPHLKMDKGCKFLENGRCLVHTLRPGICRLFPLGRIYQNGDFKYFLQVKECVVQDRTPVTVREWLGIEDLETNSKFINKWHKFLGFEQKKVAEIREMSGYESKRISEIDEGELEVYAGIVGDAEKWDAMKAEEYRKWKAEAIRAEGEMRIKEVMKLCLKYFYMDPYDFEKDFYTEFDERMKKSLAAIRKK